MALDEKARHRKLEARRARRRRRIAERAPGLELSPLASTKQMKSVDRRRLKVAQRENARRAAIVQTAVNGAERFTKFFLEVKNDNRARAKMDLVVRAEREAGRLAPLQRPLSSRRLQLVKLANGQEYRRRRRIVTHKWKPVVAESPASLKDKLLRRS